MKSLVVIVTLVAEALLASVTMACQCGWSQSESAAVAAADQVFVGMRVSSITVLADSPWADFKIPLQRYVFAVDTVLKGSVGTTVTVMTTGGNCDFLFTSRARYVIYLDSMTDGVGRATVCLPSRQVTSSRDLVLPPGTVDRHPPVRWRYFLEPVYRPLWASTVFLAFALRHPLRGAVIFDSHHWLSIVARASVLLSLLSVAGAFVRPLRRFVRLRRLLLTAFIAIALAEGTMYLYLRLNEWFSHYVL
jgi:hypothetical protein